MRLFLIVLLLHIPYIGSYFFNDRTVPSFIVTAFIQLHSARAINVPIHFTIAL
jgi:hypothetical protein